jgi:hypothetical protein
METLIQIPEELVNLILVGATFLVVQVLKFLSDLVKHDLSGYEAQIAAAITAAVVVLVNAGLGNVPAEYASLANGFLQFLVVVFGSFGLYKVYRQINPEARG